ncbi:MAG: hypothetical protein BGO70_15270 [Bacteroidetes bacterium 43-93]|nr:MAG: hypothetical protein BGO70_15270 [Bacteroidetes bacterium 43-93]
MNVMRNLSFISAIILTCSCRDNKYAGDRHKGDKDMPYQSENSPDNAATGTNANYDSSGLADSQRNNMH